MSEAEALPDMILECCALVEALKTTGPNTRDAIFAAIEAALQCLDAIENRPHLSQDDSLRLHGIQLILFVIRSMKPDGLLSPYKIEVKRRKRGNPKHSTALEAAAVVEELLTGKGRGQVKVALGNAIDKTSLGRSQIYEGRKSLRALGKIKRR